MKIHRQVRPKCCLLSVCVLLAAGCTQKSNPPPVQLPIEVTVSRITPRDVPLPLQYVGQTESSRLVEIRARTDGYLQKKFYTEGIVVHAGDPLFLIDPRPMQAVADSATAALKDKENWVDNTRRTRIRLERLLTENAVSKKDVEDAIAAENSAAAALEISRADHSKADMNLSYAHITSPLTGLAGRANMAEGTYINPGANGLLTTVAQIDPIWVNFSISENEWQRFAEESKTGRLRFPERFDFDVDMVLADGRTLSNRGKINFAAPSVDTQTGAYAVRASFPNSDMSVRPGQFVRVKLNGAVRPQAILVPQRAVMQGQAGKFVYVLGNASKAEVRPVEVGDWYGDEWFITAGLKGGEQIVVGGIVKVQPGATLKIISEPSPSAADRSVAPPPK